MTRQQKKSDLIEMTTGIVFDIKRYAVHDGPGIRTTVFMKGCPLACRWCHNPEGIEPAPFWAYRKSRCIGCGECVANCPEQALSLSQEGIVVSPGACRRCFTCAEICPAEALEKIGRRTTALELFEQIKKDVPFYDTSRGGVTFSGGEPLMQPDFLLKTLKLCGNEHIHRAVDTTGHARREILLSVAEETDLFLYDLKVMDPDKHEKFTGVSNHLILDNLRCLARQGADLIVRIPLVPGVNDDVENLDRTGNFLSRLSGVRKVDVLAYHDFHKSKYARLGLDCTDEKTAPPAKDSLQFVKKRLEAYGLEVAIGG